MLEIISICLNVITIGLTIYELFLKKPSDNVSQYIQNILIQQINPKYDIEVQSQYMAGKIDSVEIQNAHWKSKRITQIVIIMIYLSMAINFMSYIKANTISSLTDITAIFYIPLRNTMIQLSTILIILCIIMTIRGWNKQQSVLSNFISMKYFTLKILTDFFSAIGFILVDYSFLEKINVNIQNPIYSFNVIGWAVQFLFQILWIQFTISKLNKLVPVAITYEAKEKQIFSFIPVYIISLLLFGLTVYTKFF